MTILSRWKCQHITSFLLLGSFAAHGKASFTALKPFSFIDAPLSSFPRDVDVHHTKLIWRTSAHRPQRNRKSNSSNTNFAEIVGNSGSDVVGRTLNCDINATKNVQIFLRFSPLINGPSLFPLHVEVIFAVDNPNCNNIERIDKFSARKPNNLLPVSTLNECFQLHRFDFIPVNPTDPSIVTRLLSFRPIPGRVRYRAQTQCMNESADSSQDVSDKSHDNSTLSQYERLKYVIKHQREYNGNQNSGFGRRGVTVVFPIGYALCRVDQTNTSLYEVVSAAIEFTANYRNLCGGELRILGGKNCLSFAMDLLSHLEDIHGIYFQLSPPRIEW